MSGELRCDSLWYGADIVTMQEGKYSIIPNGAIAVRQDRIVWIGPWKDAKHIRADIHNKLDGGIVTPGFVDCHTHLVFGGDRSHEFEQRLNGVSYSEIAAQGGGIISTVTATRKASLDELVASASWRLERLLAEGVTTVEIKSGYGLDQESELRMLKAIRQLAKIHPVQIRST